MATATKVGIDDKVIELTGSELEAFEADRAKTHQEHLDRKATEAANAIKREALLAKLGITADEAALLLG